MVGAFLSTVVSIEYCLEYYTSEQILIFFFHRCFGSPRLESWQRVAVQEASGGRVLPPAGGIPTLRGKYGTVF